MLGQDLSHLDESFLSASSDLLVGVGKGRDELNDKRAEQLNRLGQGLLGCFVGTALQVLDCGDKGIDQVDTLLVRLAKHQRSDRLLDVFDIVETVQLEPLNDTCE